MPETAGTPRFTGTHKVAIAFAAAALVVGISAVAALSALRQVQSATEASKYTANLLVRADELLAGVIDAERVVRGYVITTDSQTPAAYGSLRNGVEADMKELRSRVAGRASRESFEAIQPLIEDRFAQMTEAVELRRHRDGTAAAAIAAGRAGEQTMAALRAATAEFSRAENVTLAQDNEAFTRSMRSMFLIVLIVCGLALLFPISFSYQIYAVTQRRLKDLVHAETRRLLEVQEDVNRQLQLANLTLHVSEEKLAVTLNSIDDAVIATDSDGRVTFLNPLAERLTGWTRVEAAGQPVDAVFRILNSDTRERIPLPVKDTLAHGTTLSLAEHTLAVARDGGECDIADSCAPIRDREGKVVGAVLVFRDVTEKKRMDLALREKNVLLEAARATADKANLAKSDFLSSMSHELRTPLNAILGFAQLMETGAPPPTPNQKRNLDQILKAGWYLLDLINGILDLAVIESGKVTLSREPVPLLEVMLECRAMIEPEAKKRGIEMRFPRFEVPFHVNADRMRVKQILINLLYNAIKYNSTGGLVTVECGLRTPETLRVSVRDTGKGVAPERMAQLFQPFNRLGLDAGGEEGTGIGLVVTKRLVELMGGRIGVDSTVGVGSVFWIELAVAQPRQLSEWNAEDSLPPRLNAAADTEPRTVLYVEDNPANLQLVEQLLLRRPDLRMLSAADGLNGVELARASHPKVILMDVNLPGLNGMEAMQILRLDPATSHIPIIALSANAMPRDIGKALEAGFYNYLTKPIKVDDFYQALDAALEYSRNAAGRQANKETAP